MDEIKKKDEVDLLNEVVEDLRIHEKKNEVDLLNEVIDDLRDAIDEASNLIKPSITSDPLFYFRNMLKKYKEKKADLSDELINLMLNKLEG